MKPIFLIGYMGSGKTTLGRALAAHLGMRFIDLDEAIEERHGATISRIFEQQGEAAFRRMERQELKRVAQLPDTIIACGGGTPCQPGNIDIMHSHGGISVWLDASIARLHARLSEARMQRPLIAGIADSEQLRQYITDSLAQRRPYYRRAKHIFCADRLDDAEQIAQSIDSFITQILTP